MGFQNAHQAQKFGLVLRKIITVNIKEHLL